MPYTKKELETNTFYQNFVDNLQLNYLKELVEYSKTGFRKRGILYSFEDIVTTNGIEDANIEGKENLDNLYRRHLGPKVITSL